MAIIKQILTEFELKTNQQVTIELNEGDKIHIHIDNLRYSFDKNEFHDLATILQDGEKKLNEIKENKYDKSE